MFCKKKKRDDNVHKRDDNVHKKYVLQSSTILPTQIKFFIEWIVHKRDDNVPFQATEMSRWAFFGHFG